MGPSTIWLCEPSTSCGRSDGGSSTMLKRNLLSRWSQQAEPGDEDDLGQQQPHVEERATDHEADTERRELRGHAELRERADGEKGRAFAKEPLGEPVLPA